MLIDDCRHEGGVSALGSVWRAVSDRVMGGISQPALSPQHVAGKRCLRLSGAVQLENNGGFIQMALDLDPAGAAIDVSEFAGVRLLVLGNDEQYSVHLRTADNQRPWQSYRAHFKPSPQWREIKLPFTQFTPHRLDTPLDLSCMRRIGVVAIGRAFFANLCVAEIAFYR